MFIFLFVCHDFFLYLSVIWINYVRMLASQQKLVVIIDEDKKQKILILKWDMSTEKVQYVTNVKKFEYIKAVQPQRPVEWQNKSEEFSVMLPHLVKYRCVYRIQNVAADA